MHNKRMVINQKQQTQFHSFDNLPRAFSDIDGFRIEAGKYAVFLEGKHERNTKLNGQVRLMKTLCDHLGIPSIYLVYVHNTPEHLVVDVAKCMCLEYYVDGIWYDKVNKPLNDVINNFIKKHE